VLAFFMILLISILVNCILYRVSSKNYLAPDKGALYRLDFMRHASASSVAFTTSGVDYSGHDLGEMLPLAGSRVAYLR